ncbi:hypothetical protein FACS189490_07950 [Clostridia bacterium]|nr:hypothetical protein FACS189490_07950 [Clostridia bacterium]
MKETVMQLVSNTYVIIGIYTVSGVIAIKAFKFAVRKLLGQ